MGAAIPGLSEGGVTLSPSQLKSNYPDKTHVQITVENDHIKVTTDNQNAYALPAECPIHIAMAVPTNSSALTENIGKVCANFLRDNLYHTRGVYASLIPYSGKLSALFKVKSQ